MMHKRYLRIDLEYEFTDSDSMRLYMPSEEVELLIQNQLPKFKIIFTRDTSSKENLGK